MIQYPIQCPVCKYSKLNEAPYDYADCASFEICPKCGTQFGYDDANTSHAVLRARWLKRENMSEEMIEAHLVLCKHCRFRRTWCGQIEHNECLKVPLHTDPVYGTQTYKACEEVNHSCQCTMFQALQHKPKKWWQFWK